MLLTIAIPTLNGARFLEETVRSIWTQVQGLNDVEIVIVDNASSDDSLSVLSQLSCEGLIFRLEKNEHRLSAGENFMRAVEVSSGQYVWLVADDDVLVPGSIEVMLATISHDSKPNVVVANFMYADETLSVMENHPHNIRVRLNQHDQAPTSVVLSGTAAFQEIGLKHIGLLSANCFRRDLFLAEGKTSNVPEGFDFMYIIPAMMLSGQSVFIRSPQVLFRQYKKRWETGDDYADALKIEWLITPIILSGLIRRGYPRRFMTRLTVERSVMFLWHINEAKKLGFKPSPEFFLAFLRVNKRNLILLAQLPLFLLSPKTLQRLASVYTSSIGTRLKRVFRGQTRG